jgi:hypothetical protein
VALVERTWLLQMRYGNPRGMSAHPRRYRHGCSSSVLSTIAGSPPELPFTAGTTPRSPGERHTPAHSGVRITGGGPREWMSGWQEAGDPPKPNNRSLTAGPSLGSPPPAVQGSYSIPVRSSPHREGFGLSPAIVVRAAIASAVRTSYSKSRWAWAKIRSLVHDPQVAVG